jgi:hypothetical protein
MMYESNCFITLTISDDGFERLAKERGYSNKHTLDVRDWQLFMKRLRKRYGAGIRFYMCGEYGEQSGRPHYHACIFNFDFPDKELWSVRDGIQLYRSDSLEELWPYGFSTIGNVTFESAAYVARYIMKKIKGDNADSYYKDRVDPETGEIYSIKPEFTTMSRRPGIGKAWYDMFKADLYPHGYVVMRGAKCKVPRFYDDLLEKEDSKLFDKVRMKRFRSAMEKNMQKMLDFDKHPDLRSEAHYDNIHNEMLIRNL